MVDSYGEGRELPAPGEVQTEPAEQTATGFKLAGKLNPEESPTTYYFIYKKSGEVECEDLEGCGPETTRGGPLTGATQQEVSAEVTGLTPGTTYVYWLIARNANGTVRGNEMSFTAPFMTKAEEEAKNKEEAAKRTLEQEEAAAVVAKKHQEDEATAAAAKKQLEEAAASHKKEEEAAPNKKKAEPPVPTATSRSPPRPSSSRATARRSSSSTASVSPPARQAHVQREEREGQEEGSQADDWNRDLLDLRRRSEDGEDQAGRRRARSAHCGSWPSQREPCDPRTRTEPEEHAGTDRGLRAAADVHQGVDAKQINSAHAVVLSGRHGQPRHSR